jgi:error-prone DNA polymerase
MVLCRGRLDEVVPLEPASMPGRVVIQWDKDDCADMGIIKVDLLGLGMMAVLQDAIGMVNKSALKDEGQAVMPRKWPVLDLGHLPQDDPDVYQMLQEADTIGVFQVESRAQMATLPRLRPACFYDLVVEVALIRPGPIVGKMVHPYLKRRSGQAPVVYAHPAFEPILRRTLGVPLFQEQLLRMAMVAAGFSGGEAEELRRAFGFKRSDQKMEQIESRLRVGMARQGITDEAADEIVRSITSFAMYGFPESHAASFALLVYASAYLKVHFPTVFYVALLNNQPMGFYHPATLIRDAQRRGIKFQEINVQRSDWLCTVEEEGVIRLGLRYVLGLRESVGQLIQSARNSQKRLPGCNARFNSIDDLVARTKIWRNELVALAQIGALSEFGHDRRAALWQVEHAIRPAGELFQKSESANQEIDNISPLSSMTPMECVVADYVGTGLTLGPHPMAFRRDELVRRGVTFARDLPKAGHGCSVRVAGAVVTRQRPSTAKGFVFLTLEDETGLANIIIRPDLFSSECVVITKESFLMVEGTLQIQERVVSIKAERIQRLAGDWPEIASHDFH